MLRIAFTFVLLVASALTAVSQPPRDFAADAVAAFKKKDYEEADHLFAATGAAKLTAEQKTAWAYCRIKLAADRVNAPACDAATAAAAMQDATYALQLVTPNTQIHQLGQELLKAAQAKAGVANPTRNGGSVDAPVASNSEVLETASFRVHHGGNRELGDTVAKAAEASRKQIFERWSGPPGGAWQPKCDIVIHATADAYTKATGKPAAMTGHATVQPHQRPRDGTPHRPARRRRRSCVERAAAGTHACRTRRPIRGQAAAEVGRGRNGDSRRVVGRDQPLHAHARTLRPRRRIAFARHPFRSEDFPADKITGYYCQSVSVTEYLIKLNGERNFKIFLSDAQRYGTAQALRAAIRHRQPASARNRMEAREPDAVN